MLAVLQPANSPFYFFTARKDDSGRHLFATTNEEQNANQALIDSGEDLSAYDTAYTEYMQPPAEESTWIEPERSIAAVWRRDETAFQSA